MAKMEIRYNTAWFFSRGVAQPGSASALGAEGREFESRRPDHFQSQSKGLSRSVVPVFRLIDDVHYKQHDGHFNQHTHNRGKRRTRLESKQADGSGDS